MTGDRDGTRMVPDTRTTIIVVSDLHLGAGRAASAHRGDLPEPFAHDLAFAHWLDVLREQALVDGGNHWLLLLGDLFDFPRVRSLHKVQAPLQSIDESAIGKLNRIAAGHPDVFAALRRWLASGLLIDIVPGNHDFELMRTAVHEHLGRLLAPPGGMEPVSGKLKVFPWIYYVPGLLYAEHGQQYHDLNSFPALVELETEAPARRYLPPGAALDTFALAVTGKLGPEVDSPDSITRLLRNILHQGPGGVVRVIPGFVRLLAALGVDLVARRLPQHRIRRDRYRSVTLAAQAATTGNPVRVLAEIDRLAETTANGLPGRVVRAGLPGRHAADERPPADYMVRAASRILGILDEAKMGTPFYVFGHSHRPMQVALDVDGSSAFYINGGAWAWQGGKQDPLLTFVRLSWDPTRGEATASLEKWNDQLGKVEPLGTPATVRTRETS